MQSIPEWQKWQGLVTDVPSAFHLHVDIDLGCVISLRLSRGSFPFPFPLSKLVWGVIGRIIGHFVVERIVEGNDEICWKNSRRLVSGKWKSGNSLRTLKPCDSSWLFCCNQLTLNTLFTYVCIYIFYDVIAFIAICYPQHYNLYFFFLKETGQSITGYSTQDGNWNLYKIHTYFSKSNKQI